MDQGAIQSETPSVDSRLAGLADRLRSTPPIMGGGVEVEVEDTPEAPAAPVVAEADAPEPAGQPVEDLVEVDYEGTKAKVPKQLKDALLRQADYTRKTQETAALRKSLEERARVLEQQVHLSGHLAPALGQLANLDAQIRGIHEQLSPDLEANDPIKYSTLGTKLNTLLYQRQQFANGLQAHQQQLLQTMNQYRLKALQERMQAELPRVQAAIKDFSPSVGKELAEYAKTSGYSQEEIEAISFSAPGVISLWKAREYDRLQSAKPVVQKQTQGLPPVAKPGARGSVETEQNARLKEVTDDWKKSGGRNADQLAYILRNRQRKKS